MSRKKLFDQEEKLNNDSQMYIQEVDLKSSQEQIENILFQSLLRYSVQTSNQMIVDISDEIAQVLQEKQQKLYDEFRDQKILIEIQSRNLLNENNNLVEKNHQLSDLIIQQQKNNEYNQTLIQQLKWNIQIDNKISDEVKFLSESLNQQHRDKQSYNRQESKNIGDNIHKQEASQAKIDQNLVIDSMLQQIYKKDNENIELKKQINDMNYKLKIKNQEIEQLVTQVQELIEENEHLKHQIYHRRNITEESIIQNYPYAPIQTEETDKNFFLFSELSDQYKTRKNSDIKNELEDMSFFMNSQIKSPQNLSFIQEFSTNLPQTTDSKCKKMKHSSFVNLKNAKKIAAQFLQMKQVQSLLQNYDKQNISDNSLFMQAYRWMLFTLILPSSVLMSKIEKNIQWK